MSIPSIIAIDGPVAAGKSVVGQLLAQHLGYRYLDTGAMYRALTWAALNHGVDPDDGEMLVALADRVRLEVDAPTVNDGRPYTVLVNGCDVTWEVRSARVELAVSQVSRVPGVRRVLVARQRELAQEGRIVVVGRDVGTVVLPDAGLKIFLVASAEVRARRRYQELVSHRRPVIYTDLLAQIVRRDQIDSQRAISPLRPAPDAVIVDTDSLTVEQVLARIEEIIERGDP